MPWLAEPQYLLTRERQGQCRPLWNMREVWEMKGQGDSGVCSPIAGRGRVTLSPQALPVWVGMGWEWGGRAAIASLVHSFCWWILC